MRIQAFVQRCDAFCAATGKSRVWLSKRLFQDTYRLDELAADRTDIGVKTLDRAEADLSGLESEFERTGQAA